MGTNKYFGAAAWLVLAMAAAAEGERWRWPEAHSAPAAPAPLAPSGSVRVATRVRLEDAAPRGARDSALLLASTTTISHQGEDDDDEVTPPFSQPTDTAGFYNRPPGAQAGRYPVSVRVEAGHPRTHYNVDTRNVYPVHATDNAQRQRQQQHYDGTVDSFQYCKCTYMPECNPRSDSEKACGVGKYLCCYKRKKNVSPTNSEIFNEIEDERPMLYPGQESVGGLFPSPDEADGPRGGQPEVLVGPGGPSGQVGPPRGGAHSPRPVLVGPEGPTGLVGPDRQRGDAGPDASAQRGVLVGPGGPTGVLGPYGGYGQRGVLVGPGGPTGLVGPAGRGARRGVLAGPYGASGRVGPYYGRQGARGLLVGPGGPTGTIGPGRPLLVGPGGPSGVIGPQTYFGNYNY